MSQESLSLEIVHRMHFTIHRPFITNVTITLLIPPRDENHFAFGENPLSEAESGIDGSADEGRAATESQLFAVD
jgi:hypothetical protein